MIKAINAYDDSLYAATTVIAGELKSFSVNDIEKYKSIDNNYKQILLNNGCAISNGAKMNIKFCSDIAMVFIIGAIGNEVNEYYDYMEAFDVKTIFIFLDYFKDMQTEVLIVDDNEALPPEAFIANSTYFIALRRIFEVFMIAKHGPAVLMNNLFNKTVLGTNFRYNPCIAAGIVMNIIRPLLEEDVEGCGIEYNYLMHLIQECNSYKELLIGIRGDDNYEGVMSDN